METKSVRSDDKIELTVTLPEEAVKKQIDAAYKKAGNVRIPGFRPGKAPRKILENYYGGKEYFLAEATDGLVRESLPLAVDAEGHVPLDKPEVGEIDPVEEGKPYTYSLSYTVRPMFELTSYEPLEIELESEEPTDEEISEQIDVMLNYYAEQREVTDRPVQDGDLVTMDIELSSDGERVEAMSGEKIPYLMGGGVMPASFDDKLVGAKVDKALKFDIGFDGEEIVPSFIERDKKYHAEIKVSSIEERVKPELTDEFAKEQLEFESAEDFKQQIAETLKFRKASDLASLKERRIADELAKRLDGEPTELLLSQTEQEIYRDFFAALQQSGQSFDAFLSGQNITPDTFREDIKAQAVEVASQALALDSMARHLGLEVTEDEIRAEFEASGAEDPEALFANWKENGRLSEIREGLLRMKASKQVTEDVVIFELGKKPAEKKTAKKSTKKVTAEKDSKASTKDSAKETKADKAAKSDKVEKAEAASPATAAKKADEGKDEA